MKNMKNMKKMNKMKNRSKFLTSEWEDIIAKHLMNIRVCRDGDSVRVYTDDGSGKEYRLY